MHKHTFLLLWPWPWPDKLDTWISAEKSKHVPPLNNSNDHWKRLCLVSWAVAPCVWTLRAPTRNLLAYLLTYQKWTFQIKSFKSWSIPMFRCLMFRPSACQLSAVVPFRLLVLRSGTAYQMMSPPLCPCQPSGTVWRHTYSAAVTTLSDSAVLTLTIVVLVVALLLRPL